MLEVLLAFAALFSLIFLRVPVAIAMLVVGWAGFAMKVGVDPGSQWSVRLPTTPG